MRCSLRINGNYDDCSEDVLLKNNVIYSVGHSKRLTIGIIISEINSDDIKIKEVYLNIAGKIFKAKRIDSKKIIYEVKKEQFFLCIWGYCRACIKIKTDDTTYTFFSGFVNVLLNTAEEEDENISESILKMVEFTILNNNSILQAESSKRHSLVKMSLGNYGMTGSRDIFEELMLLNNIVESYSRNYREFSRNLKYKLKDNPKIDNLDKLKKITPNTIKYISTHVNELEEVDYSTGIEYKGRNFQPRRVLIYQKEYDYDIYENQVVIGFLKMVIADVEDRIEEFKKGDYNRVKVSKVLDIRDILFVYKNDYYNKLKVLLDDLENIYSKYRYLMKGLETKSGFVGVKPTSIFLKNKHYREIYQQAENWIKKKSYNLDKDEIMHSMTTIDRIYEYYSLFKMMKLLKEELNYSLVESKFYRYKIEDNDNEDEYIDYKMNEHVNNTFVFRDKDENEIVFYYQPVVYSYKFENEIGLYRIDGKKRYYTPDFIIKVKTQSLDKYIILDAKWQNRKTLTINGGDLCKIAFKYGFSLDCDEKSELEEIFILQGKDSKEECNNEVYVHQSSPLAIGKNKLKKPGIGIIPLTPNHDEIEYLKEVLQQLKF